MKWAAVSALQIWLAFSPPFSVARIRGLENLSCLDTWGFARKASLHPRLYAYTCSRRLKAETFRAPAGRLQKNRPIFGLV